ncbi:hypothetical protein [Burkholderia sp. 3C]
MRQELLWSSILCNLHAQQLSVFISKRSTFEAAVLRSDFDQALFILDSVEDKFGLSLWSIECRFACLSEAKRDADVATLFSKLSVRHSAKQVPLLSNMLVGFTWLRCNKAVSQTAYLEMVTSALDTISAYRDHERDRQYFTFKANAWNFEQYYDVDFASILNAEANSSLIDRFLTLNRIITLLATSTRSEHQSLANDALHLLGSVSDESLQELDLFLNSAKQYLQAPPASLTYYLDGDSEASAAAFTGTEAQYDRLDARDLLAAQVRASSWDPGRSGTEVASLRGAILVDFEKFIARTSDSEGALERLYALCQRFSMSSWTTPLAARLEMEQQNQLPWQQPNRSARMFAVKLPPGDHQQIRYCPEKIFTELTESPSSLHSMAEVEVRIRNKEDLNSELLDRAIADDAYRTYMQGWWALSVADDGAALSAFSAVVEDENLHIRNKARAFYLQLLLTIGQLERFIRCAISYFKESPSIRQNIPWDDFLNMYRSEDYYEELKGIPSIPILLFVFDEFKGLHRKREINEAIDDILDHFSVRNPVDIPLSAFESAWEQSLFLKSVCTPDHREGSFALSTQVSVYEERIAICEYLAQSDSAHEREYRQEAVDLRELLTVRSLLASYNEAKIYVDEDSVRRLFETSGRDHLAAIRKQGHLAPETLELFDGNKKSATLQIGANADYFLLLQPYTAFRDIFVLEKRYGLNTTISVSIRHGIIDGKVKASLAKHGLTARSLEVSPISSARVLNRALFDLLEDHERLSMRQIIGKLHSNIEAVIKEFKGTVLQTRVSRNKAGAFDFIIDQESGYTTGHIIALSRFVNEKTTYDDFCTILLNQFWERTESGLKVIREHITSIFKGKILDCYDQVLTAIPKSDFTSKIAIRNLLIQSKNDCIRDLDELVTWFKRGKAFNYESFRLSMILQTSEMHTRQLYPECEFSLIVKDDTTSSFKGRIFHPLLTTFNILFENIVTHSHLISPKVTISLSENEDVLTVKMENTRTNLFGFGLIEDESRLQSTIESLEKKNYYEGVDEEGRSGLKKVKKLITSDLNCDLEIEAVYSNPSTFSLTLQIQVGEIKG